MRLNGLLGLLRIAEKYGIESLAASAIALTLEHELESHKESWFSNTTDKAMFQQISQVTISKIRNLLRDFDKGVWNSGSPDLQELAKFTAKLFLLDNTRN